MFNQLSIGSRVYEAEPYVDEHSKIKITIPEGGALDLDNAYSSVTIPIGMISSDKGWIVFKGTIQWYEYVKGPDGILKAWIQVERV